MAIGAGAAVVHDGEAWAYHPEAPTGTLGAVVAWSLARGAAAVNLLLDGTGAREAFLVAGFADPSPRIWSVDDRSIRPATAAEPHIEPAPACPAEMAILREAGLEVVADHGVWIGELNGLEVARVGHRDGECSIDIGVGAYDQFASSALAGDRDRAEALGEVVDMVRPHRLASSAPHPMGRLVRSRWLRAQVVRQPDLLGLDALDPIPLLEARPGLMETQPAAALGRRGDEQVVVVFTVGLDLGITETAAGLIALHAPDAAVIALPERDRHPRIVEASAALACPTEVVSLVGEWSD